MVVGALLVAALVLAGCGSSAAPVSAPAETPAADPPEQVTLTLWVFGGGFEGLIADFERENPGIRVDAQLSAFDQHHTALRSVLDTGADEPDVAVVERAYLPSFMAVPGDLSDLRERGADDFATEYLTWRWGEGVDPTGAVVGFPTDVGGLAFAYRSDLFADAGLPSDPEGVAELLPTGRASSTLRDVSTQLGSTPHSWTALTRSSRRALANRRWASTTPTASSSHEPAPDSSSRSTVRCWPSRRT